LILSAFLLGVTVAPETADDRLFRLGGEAHILEMRLHDDFFGNPAHQGRLKGTGFASACAAHFLSFQTVEPRYTDRLRPIVIGAMRDIVPADRLATARLPIGHDPAIVAWRNKVNDAVRERGAAVLTEAAADYARVLPEQLRRMSLLSLPQPDPANRSAMNAPQLGISCFTYFGNNRETILAQAKSGETR